MKKENMVVLSMAIKFCIEIEKAPQKDVSRLFGQ
jgi:hypothetical protein